MMIYFELKLIHFTVLIAFDGSTGLPVDVSFSPFSRTSPSQQSVHFTFLTQFHFSCLCRYKAIRPSQSLPNAPVFRGSAQFTYIHVRYVSTPYLFLHRHLYLSLQQPKPPPYSKMLPRVVSVGTMVGKMHLVDYIAHEVPLPLFGLGYDWACIFRGAPLPLSTGQA